MARVIAVALSKGGTGKTTTAINLADGLARRGNHVLLVDTDTQGQCGFMLGLKPKAGIAEIMAGEVALSEALIQARSRLWLLAGGRALAGVKRMVDRREFGGEMMLTEALSQINIPWLDYVLLDCGPGWDALSVNALFAAQEVLSPVSCEVLALQGLGEFLRSLESIQRYKPELRLSYILPTFADRRVKKTAEILARLQEHFGGQLCAPIRYSVSLSQAAAFGQTIFEFAPRSVGADDYGALALKVMTNDTR
jgi:chromosome partitioning protein